MEIRDREGSGEKVVDLEAFLERSSPALKRLGF
jgi:hypothetical protein